MDAYRASNVRRTIRYVAAGLAAATTLLYLLIGLRIVTVIQDQTQQPAFALPAAVVFGLLTVLLLVADRRLLWAGVAVFVGLVIAMYFGVAPQREPQFETWGLLIRVVQVGLVVALGYLTIRPGRSMHVR
jgi:predicted permease